jgi:glucose-6-phosphate isomerase
MSISALRPLAENLPATLALLACWYRGFLGAQTLAVVPYAQALGKLPSYLQQLEMESNGKSVQLDGSPVDTPTGAIVWGTAGTNGQHAYFQLLHQGTTLVPIDFIGFLRAQPDHELGRHQESALRQRARPGRSARVRQAGRGGRGPRASPPSSCRTGRSRATARRSVLVAEQLTPTRWER